MKLKKNHAASKEQVGFLYWAAALLFLIFTLGPLVWAFIVSITPEHEMFKNTARFLPETPTFDNFIRLFTVNRQSKLFWKSVANSLSAAALTLIIGMPCAICCAYALSRLRFPGRKVIRAALFITMAIPVFSTIIPLYKMFSDYRLLDNLFWLSLVYVTSFLPLITWFTANWFHTIPRELEEAAYLDGCGRLQTFFKVILPISGPILFSAALMIVLMSWNQFQIPLILASSRATKPVSIITSEFVVKDSVQYGLTTAAGLTALFPPAVLALFFHKFLIRGLTGGAVKG